MGVTEAVGVTVRIDGSVPYGVDVLVNVGVNVRVIVVVGVGVNVGVIVVVGVGVNVEVLVGVFVATIAIINLEPIVPEKINRTNTTRETTNTLRNILPVLEYEERVTTSIINILLSLSI